MPKRTANKSPISSGRRHPAGKKISAKSNLTKQGYNRAKPVKRNSDNFESMLIGGLVAGGVGVLLGMFASEIFTAERSESKSFAKAYGNKKQK